MPTTTLRIFRPAWQFEVVHFFCVWLTVLLFHRSLARRDADGRRDDDDGDERTGGGVDRNPSQGTSSAERHSSTIERHPSGPAPPVFSLARAVATVVEFGTAHTRRVDGGVLVWVTPAPSRWRGPRHRVRLPAGLAGRCPVRERHVVTVEDAPYRSSRHEDMLAVGLARLRWPHRRRPPVRRRRAASRLTVDEYAMVGVARLMSRRHSDVEMRHPVGQPM